MSHHHRLRHGPRRAIFGFAMPGFKASIAGSRRAGETVFEHCEPNPRIFVTLDGVTAAFVFHTGAAPAQDRPD